MARCLPLSAREGAILAADFFLLLLLDSSTSSLILLPSDDTDPFLSLSLILTSPRLYGYGTVGKEMQY